MLRVQLGLVQIPVPLVALGEAGHALTTGLEGLDDLVAIAAQAQGHAGLGEVAGGGVEVLVEELAALPAGFVALFQQRMVAQGFQGLAAGAKLDFGLFVHGRRLSGAARGWLPRP
ncbi:hypothetical protein D3C72_1858510 [compost metagenome]